MSVEKELRRRSSSCELCGQTEGLRDLAVSPKTDDDLAHHALVCDHCYQQIMEPEKIEVNHWHCLNDSMWSETPAVQVLAYRMLSQLKNESWAQNLLDVLYLDEKTREWAEEGLSEEKHIKTVDSNGVMLQQGDTVTVVKDLPVKGSSMVVKRGTAVRNINLVHDDPTHISGKVNGQDIYLVTKFLKK